MYKGLLDVSNIKKLLDLKSCLMGRCSTDRLKPPIKKRRSVFLTLEK